MSRARMIEIDGTKLLRLLEIAGVTPKEAGIEMGFSDDYIRDCIRRGRIATNAVKSLERVYKIKAEDIVRKDEQPEQEEEKTEVPEADLKQIIEEAVLAALKSWKAEEIVTAMEKWREETKA